ncbi:uncharacterized protein FIBRA_08523 [Fibroporia radiculosa]|uniref:O-methyltransferase dimerisation domain-containing protein n=1 Tax=Fibroporia radiculosa TaxID=599839 RepID=J4GHL9_9APHY|nr:uncharacterized protein FIBRA_08523 [Fibroporia radiculosa]CCM06273.1 predicted protein [Fibroporia radiculosa]
MDRSSSKKAETLRALMRMLVDASEVVIKQWDAEDQPYLPGPATGQAPSQELFEARRIILGACGMCADLVQDPLERLSEISFSYLPARALHIAAEARVFDILAETDPSSGMDIQDISHCTGINAGKLIRILRCLCSLHIFSEVKPSRFANSSTSQAVVGNDPFRSWLILK